ncbi:amino acid adenylation domain-containing protein [Streptomyces sp. NPDC000229]|uniref:amino acid adenylation domain-containing protein n=1 Tax=Streptomyces sp. NPDC000229 TaxID=3154247 RepID=UPI00332F7814
MTGPQTSQAEPTPTDAAALREELLRRRLAGSAARTGSRAVRDARPADTIPPVPRGKPLPLSSGQRQFWILHQLDPKAPDYLLPMAYRLRGPVDAHALRAACDRLTARHEILRTRYVLTGTEPRQVIDPPGPADLTVTELRGLGPRERDAEAERRLEAAALDPFDLAAQPPMRIRLIRFADDDHLLVFVLHHMVCDAATRVLLLKELSELYRARTEGAAPRLGAEPVQFADYAAWLTAREDSAAAREELDWWRRHLAGLDPLDLPTDRPRPAVRSWAGAEQRFTVPRHVATRLRALADEQGASLFMVVLTAFQTLLARHTGGTDIAVGTAVSARTRDDLTTMAGYAYNTLVLRARWEGDPAFRHLLADNRGTVLAAFDHAGTPFDRLAEALAPERDLSTTPVYQVMFDLAEAAATEPLDLPGVDVAPVDVPCRTSRFDLTMHLEERPDGSIDGALEYATALFDATTAERLTGHYTRLLDAVSAAPDTPVSALDIFDDAERTLLIDGRPDPVGTRAPLDPAALRPVHEAIALQASRTPDAPAVFHGDRTMTYRELDAHACRTGHLLRELGAGPERTVGVLLDVTPETVATLLGIWRTGAAYVPLDPGYPDDRLAHMVADTGTELIVTERRHATRLAGTGARLLVVDDDADRAALQRQATTPLTPPPGGHDIDHLAYVIYTSGSTGRPKGVLVSHRGLANYLHWTVDAYASAGRGGAPFFSSLAFDLGVPDLYTPLMTGEPVHLLDQDTDITELGAQLVRRAPYSFVKLTPGHLDLLTKQLTGQQAASLAGVVIAAGDSFTGRLANRWLDMAGPDGTRLAAEYGPTEITVGNSAYFIDGPQDAELVSIGRAIPHTSMRVLDRELRPVPIGGVGEVCVSGIGLARGYARRPAQTAERFLPDPYGPPGSRLYRTGDLARVLPDGNLDFVSRADHQVKLRGYRIEPGEIETVLTADPAVAEAVALVREDAPGDRRLVAYLVPAADADPAALAPARLRELLGASLPEYMVPSAFVTLPDLPLTANGKLDRRALPAPGREAAAVGEHVAPRTDDERAMAAVWSDILGLDRIGVHDNFFDLGGDSLRAVALAGVLREGGQPVAVRDIFEHRTVAALCRALGQGEGGGTERFTPVAPFALVAEEDLAALPADAVDAYPLSRTQAGMFIEMHGDSGENRYHNITSFRIKDDEPFDPDAFRAAADLVVARHEVMRTSFALTGYSQPLQIVHARRSMPCVHHDLRHLPPEERWPALTAFADRDRERLFEAGAAPLMRMATHVLDDDGWWLSITEGHPAIEGWSYHNQLMELLHAYRRLRAGQDPEPAPPAPALRYADFIAAELRSLADPEDRAHWRGLIDRYEKFRISPGWAGSPEEPGERYRIDIPLHDLEPGLRALATATEVPYKSVLHAAHSKVLSMLTRQDAFRGGMVIDARPEVRGADRVSGMYLNSVPFPYERGARTWGELARQVFEAEVGLWPHRRFPMPAMREEGGERHLVDVLFHYLDFHQVDADLVDSAVTRDVSPNEFPLVVGTPTRGLLSIASDTRTLHRAFGERLARLYRAVLADMAATGAEGDARRGYPEDEEQGTEVLAHAGSPRPLDTVLAFEEQARRTPGAIALSTGTERLTYGELDALANRLARRLHAAGAGPEVCVGVLLDRGIDLVVTLLAVWKTGAAYVPFDTCVPDARLHALLAGTDCRIVVTGTRHERRVTAPAGTARAPYTVLLADAPEEPDALDALDAPDEAGARRAGSATPPPRVLDQDRLAYVLHTSGSTGRPKGVAVGHRALGHYLDWAVRTYLADATGGAPFFTSIGADLGVPALFGPLLTGQTVRLLPQNWRPDELGALLTAGAPYAFTGLTPGHLALLERQLDDEQLAGLAALLVVAGDGLPAGRAERIATRIAAGGGALRLVAEYGPTEATVAASAYRTEGPAVRDLVPLGRALPGTTLRVLDENLAPVPDGAVGEIHIGGPGLARGYTGRPGLTAERFLPDPYGPPGARLYRTGDLARVLPGGELEFAGRTDRQLKVRGHRVEPAEIEAALLTDPRVREALTVAVPDEAGGSRTAAWVVPVGGPGGTPTPAELRDGLRALLPEPLIPAVFRVVKELPLTEHGKYDRRDMDPAVADRTDAAVRAPYTAPRTLTERRLADVWQRVLGLRRVGVHDHFRDLGGNSLLALSVLSASRAAGLPLELSTLLRHSTVAGLAAVLDTPTER